MTPQRILVIRLDRIGDVVLTTPLVRVLREACPSARIAMLVRPDCGELLEGHPDLNDVIVYDKAGAQRSIWGTLRFAWALRAKRFDTAVIAHPTHRSHWIAWLAGIPVRIGYARKGGWLLTHRRPHQKQEGTRHEADYAVELLGALGLAASPAAGGTSSPAGMVPARSADGQPLRPVIAVSPEARARVSKFLQDRGVGESEALIAVHPSASCPSKRWPPERFAQVADALIASHGARIVVVAGPGDLPPARDMIAAMRQTPLDAAGRLSVGELAALLARCRLLISNDSGPVHVAAAVGTPVIDIFGRNQAGLSPSRWGPLGEGHVVLHREVGCRVCLAHACPIGFLCLDAISPQEVRDAAGRLLAR